jgi:hypothetical protein
MSGWDGGMRSGGGMGGYTWDDMSIELQGADQR